MPATPAWPPESSVRLFVATRLSENAQLRIEGAQAHYLVSVMRIKPGEHVRLFDDVSGEWLAQAITVNRRDITLDVIANLKPRETVPDLWLAAAPIRRARYDWVAEKSCELGIARFVPVLTRRAVVDKVKDDRLRAHMIEAAEQCGRTALPVIAAQTKLIDWLATLADRILFFADEAGGQPFDAAIATHPGPAAILIGPEGGFDDAERDAIRATPGAVPITLGPRILRADTAAIAAIAVWMALSDRS
ncbi:16S rRNA (uracil(1498)-N(3))-methyltransferase [Sphingomonas sp.]|uniref:16S rRNA (uracil(1498)-N(3))-methyltransferase n=1 Tax=Sphingomonas sp. TaxID=28214 RepID=UPI0025F6B1D0|nr:16S rRNA (uracil(1498)-N(3))-methyltransferase [Sphingomonas sp.]